MTPDEQQALMRSFDTRVVAQQAEPPKAEKSTDEAPPTETKPRSKRK